MVKNILKTGGVVLAGAALLAGCQSTEPTRAQMDAAAYQSMQNIEVVRQTETAYQEKLEKQAAEEAAAKAKADRARANANAKASKARAEKQKKIDAYNARMKEIELELKELDLLECRAASESRTLESNVKAEKARQELERLKNEVRTLENEAAPHTTSL